MSIQQATEPDATPGVTDEDVLVASQSARFHCKSQAIRFPGDLKEGERTRVQQQFDSGGFEPVPIEVVTRNRQSDAVRMRSRWDGTQLHLDVCPTNAPVMALQPAASATLRYYDDWWHRSTVFVAAIILIVAISIIILHHF